MNIRCFFLTPTDEVELSFRRYSSASMSSRCDATGRGFHDARNVVGRHRLPAGEDATTTEIEPGADHRIPLQCASGYGFERTDAAQRWLSALYKRSDTGDLVTLRDAPVGAMWFAPWLSDSPEYRGPDGETLVVRLPGNHDWIVDSRCSNCDSPCSNCGKPYHQHSAGMCRALIPGEVYDRARHYYVDARPHKCWVRHGSPPDIHVDKNGMTCGAGAGSIAYTGFHGFLHHGQITNC